MKTKQGTVCIIFTNDKKYVLLMNRNTNPYKGLLNGVGGKVELGETNLQCIIREIKEESNLDLDDFEQLTNIMDITFHDSGWHLSIFYGVLNPDVSGSKIDWNNDEGTLDWYETASCMDYNNPRLGGDGNISYWIKFALVQLGKT